MILERLYPGASSLCVIKYFCLDDTNRKCHTGVSKVHPSFCTGAIISFGYEISQRYQLHEQPLASV